MARQAPKDEMIKTTLRLPRTLFDAARHRAIDEHIDLQDLVAKALEQYLQRKGGQR